MTSFLLGSSSRGVDHAGTKLCFSANCRTYAALQTFVQDPFCNCQQVSLVSLCDLRALMTLPVRKGWCCSHLHTHARVKLRLISLRCNHTRPACKVHTLHRHTAVHSHSLLPAPSENPGECALGLFLLHAVLQRRWLHKAQRRVQQERPYCHTLCPAKQLLSISSEILNQGKKAASEALCCSMIALPCTH